MSLLDDIPLEQKRPDDLLGLYEGDDFWKVGWGFVPNLSLDGFLIKRALVLLLHAPDEPQKLANDVEIAFWLDGDDIPYLKEEIEAHTSLQKFLSLRLSEIMEHMNCSDLVLCVCNPHHSIIERPDVCDNIVVWFPKGTVYHYKEENFGHVQYILKADEWIIL